MAPTGEVGEALERVLGSETFARSGRARDLLRYLVAREQAGEADALKGYAIALDVFGRDDAFDPSTDAVVRVQASRLRDLLTQYYDGEGAGEMLRIVIPRGGYVPSYSHVAGDGPAEPGRNAAEDAVAEVPAASTTAPAPPTAPAAPRRAVLAARTVQRDLRRVWIAMSALIVLLGFVAYRVGFHAGDVASNPGAGEQGENAGVISSLVPTIHVNAQASEGDVMRVADILRGALAGFDTIEYVARPYEKSNSTEVDNSAFTFQVSRVSGASNIRVELFHAPTARSVVTREIDPSRAEDMVADLLTSVAPASGVIYAYISNNGLATPLIDCLLANDYYYRDPSEEQFIRAFDCMKQLREGGLRSPLVFSELSALELQGIVNKFDHAKDFTRENAMECARKAIQLGPTSPYAHRAYGYLLLRLGNDTEGLVWMRKAYDLNPFDLSMAASFAYALVFSGGYVEAAPILERAVRVSSAHPSWWDYSLFLAMFMLDENEKAANATVALVPTTRAHYLAARMIVAHQAGDFQKADELKSAIIEAYPVFADNPRKFFENAQYPKDLTDKLVEAIGAAGLVSAS